MMNLKTARLFILPLGIAMLHLSGGSCLAAEEATTWRATYDLIMMWVNFGILAFLLVKYLRQPLIDFLVGESRKTTAEIRRIEDSREKTELKFQETVASLDESRQRFHLIRERILRDGERRRQAIIVSAREESRLLIARTRQKLDTQIAETHMQLKRDLVDRAIDAALERLPSIITAEEHLHLVDRFVQNARDA